MKMIDEDEVGLKEKPEDTRYIKKITSNNFTIVPLRNGSKFK